jgi:hypothetical protein
MPEETGQEITVEQAEAALQELTAPETTEYAQTEPEAEPSPVIEAVEPEEPAQEVVEAAEEVHEDDLESLKQRLTQLETERSTDQEGFAARMEALQNRNVESERILRERYLRKSTATDRALQALRASRSDEGITREDVDQVIREIEGTMHPDSASFQPAPQPQSRGVATEDQALVMNSFLNEKSMTQPEADEFGNWIQSRATTVMSPAEQAVAGESLDGFLRLAHTRWKEDVRKENENTRSDAVDAVRSVQRTQRAAARAASSGGTAPKKPAPVPPAQVDLEKLTSDDVSALVRQATEQYR